MLLATDLPDVLCAEALSHANWLRNRLPASRINGEIPILNWDPRTIIDFSKLHIFGQTGYSFIYRSSAAAGSKLLPRSHFSRFIGVESDRILLRVYVPEFNTVRVVRNADFHVISRNSLPSVTSLIDGLSRQRRMEESLNQEESNTEEDLIRCMSSINLANPIVHYSTKSLGKSFLGVTDGPPLPRSFATACADPKWEMAIDREYDALVRRGTWTYIRRTPSMHPAPFKWT